MSFACLAKPQPHSFIVDFEQNESTPHHNFSIKPDPDTFFATLAINTESPHGEATETINTYSYSGSDSPPDDKPCKPKGLWKSLTTVVESVSWQLLYATGEVVGYKLLLSLQEDSLTPQSFSWMPVVATVVVGLLTRNHWNPGSALFNQLDEQESSQQHELQIITLMYKPDGGNSYATGAWGQGHSFNMHSSLTGHSHYSLLSHQGEYYDDDPGHPTPVRHSYDETCLLEPCRAQGRCIYAPGDTNQHKLFCRCRDCMAELDRYIAPQPLISTQCESTSDSDVTCSLNYYPQTDGQESAPYSGSMGSVKPKRVIRQKIVSKVIVTAEPDSTSDQPAAIKKRRAHGRVKRHLCDHPGCNYSTIYNGHLKVHQLTHSGERPFPCGHPGCNYSATQPVNLKTHQLIHSGKKPFQCDHRGCRYSASQKVHLKTHQLSHRRKKPKSKRQRPEKQGNDGDQPSSL
ncbi:hypothetical protein [Endozoicomonas euniceicola]|uniref:C2H2-type domain-containing protein n=1 Tax=Endozoicomonas euniceicola TaxID=1234143 RepID=A0ABY6GUK4_9GAMM|nr:hypothetical protein [Endozoicomonas euniceicola]UYM16461.1 hypothetical protein NX720_00560 [Endozoicomonas euniceicola]